MTPLIPSRRQKQTPANLEAFERECVRELERIFRDRGRWEGRPSRLRTLRRLIAVIATDILLAFTVSECSYKWVPYARVDLLSVGPIRLMLATELAIIAIAIAQPLLLVPRYARRPSTFLFYLVEVNAIVLIDRLL